jgi:hypothetical protein
MDRTLSWCPQGTRTCARLSRRPAAPISRPARGTTCLCPAIEPKQVAAGDGRADTGKVGQFDPRNRVDFRETDDYGPRIAQLKRALRGAAFTYGALFPLRATIADEQFDELAATLKQMQTDIASELGRVRSEHAVDET